MSSASTRWFFLRSLSAVLLAGLLPLLADKKQPNAPTSTTPADAETLDPQKKISNKPDYTSAFQKLINLGFPDATGSQYIKIKFATPSRDSQPYRYQRYTIKRDGNAWLLPTENQKEPTRTIIHDGFHLEKITQKEKRNLLVRLLAGNDDETHNGIRKAEWTKIDAAKEVDEIIKQMNSDPNLANLFKADSWSYDTSPMETLGELLMTACHFHRSGQIEAGNKLAHSILTKAPYPFKVIDHLIGRLATTAYQDLLADLYAQNDWNAFLKGIRDLSTKYPRGWQNQPGLNILIPKVVSHIRFAKTKITPFKGQPLDPKVTASLNQLLKPDKSEKQINASSPICWLINPTGETKSQYSRGHPTPDWVSATIQRGMDIFPTLIAASADHTLIPAPLAHPDSNSHQSHSFINRDSDEESDIAIYDKMPRPCTRGEIIRAILKQTLPTEIADWSTLSPEQFQLIAYEWWSENKSKSLPELGVLFLKDGDPEQQSVTLQILLKNGDESAYPFIEKFILSSDSLMQNVDLAKQYLTKRKGKGKQFHDTFVKELRLQTDSTHRDDDQKKTLEKHLDKLISGLSVLVNDTSPEEIIKQISKGEISIDEGLPLLKIAIGEGAYLEKFGILITFISRLEEPTDRLKALNELQTWIYDNDRSFPEGDQTNDYQKELRQLASTHRQTWNTFLIRKTPLPLKNKTIISLGSPPTEAHYAAMVMNNIHHPETRKKLNAINTISTSQEAWDLLLERMETFANSGKAPPFPAANNVPEKRQQAILAKVKDLSTQQIIPYRKSLNLSERLAIAALLEGLEKRPKNIAALANLCQKIDWSRASSTPQTIKDRIESILLGQEISAKLVEAVFQLLREEDESFLLFFQSNSGALSGPRLMGSSTQSADNWLQSFIAEDLAKLNIEKTTRLEALIAFGIDQEDGAPLSAVRFLEPLDQAEEKASFDELLRKALILFEPSEEKQTTRTQAGFVLATETFKNQNSSSTQEDQ